MKIREIILLSVILITRISYPQYTNYNANNGLPSNHVYRITQDVNGFIWMITDKGMVKFNGSTFKTFTIRDGLPTNDIWNIVATPNGNIWCFSKSPKIGYIQNDSIYAFPSEIKGEILNPMNRSILGNEITFNNSTSHYELKNNQWEKRNIFGRFSNLKQYHTYLKHTVLDRFQFSEDKKLLLFFDKKNRKCKEFKSPKSIILAHTRAQINDSTYVWLSDVGYTVLNLNNYKIKTILFKDIIQITKSKYVRMHLVNNQVQITGVGFVSVLDKKYNLINTHYIPKRLKAHFSFIDKQDNVWIATFTNGVYKLPASKKNAVYTLTNYKTGKIKKIGTKILTTVLNKGFYMYDSIDKQFKPYIKETHFSYGAYAMKALNKQYFITDNKITTFEGSKKTIKYGLESQGFFNETARQLAYHNGFLYGNFTMGLNKLNSSDLSIKKKYLSNGIRTFTSFKDTLVIATSNGLKVLKKDSIVPLHVKKNTSSQLHKKPILNLTVLDASWLLVGTDGYGAFITNLVTIIPLKETNYLSVSDAFVEKKNLWLATDKGALLFHKNASNNYTYSTTYSEKDGLLLKNVKSVYATLNDLIISSNLGVVTIPKKKRLKNQLLDLYVSSIKYNDKKIVADKVNYTSNNTLSFNIASVDFSENEKLSYTYQLQPIQNKWFQSSTNHLTFNNLSPQDYKLHIQSQGITKTIAFKILPLWYQTMWFKLLLLIGFLGLLYFFNKWNKVRILKAEKIKIDIQQKFIEQELFALRSQMNPHFVFNSLAAIQYYINENDFEASETYLIKFSRLIRQFFDISKQKSIVLKEEIALLTNYLEIEQLRFKERLSFKIEVDDKLDLKQRTIPTMLLQPIVENAVNHGLFNKLENGLITIIFKYIDNASFKVAVIDDGVGFENTLKRASKKLNSSKVLKERLQFFNQSKRWKISYLREDMYPKKQDKGTIITFIISKVTND